MRKILFPDANDRTVNNPSTLINKIDILRLYNQSHDEKATSVTDGVKKWINEEAQQNLWSKCEFSGEQCLLTANVVISSKRS